ncbi:MAG: hypothetical protein KGI06_01440 [Candidatus Micrarchaeota archaeon]|nr:hypothetical protein [Candidatus Micrarchaeota archaeon]
MTKQQKVKTNYKERVWSVEEGERLMHQRNPNNLMLRSAELEAKRDYDGAIKAIESAIKKNPKTTPLTFYLSDLLRRKQIYESGIARESKKHKTARA